MVPPAKPTTASSPIHRGMSLLGGKIKKLAGTSLRITAKTVGLVGAVSVAWHYYQKSTVEAFFGESDAIVTDGDGKVSREPKKRVLILPFDNLKLVEKRRSGAFDPSNFQPPTQNKRPTIVLETKELVEIIHEAASDPNVTGVYADFGEGMRYPLEYAHIEEIRSAIRIFNESHRVHRSPNVDHNPVFAMSRNGDPKASCAFGHSFGWREYFLASAFTNVCLQPRGHLELGGAVFRNFFVGDMFRKYGVKAHVFKHGDYKNAPNTFSERAYTKPHLENVQSMTSSLNNTIRTSIQNSQALKFDEVMWKSIFDYGSLTAANAKEIGLVNATPSVSPITFAVEANKDAKKSKMETLFGLDSKCFSNFKATEMMPVMKYKQMMDRRKNVEKKHATINDCLYKLAELSTATSLLLSAFGIHPNKSNCEKIAVVTVDGNIAPDLSYRVIESIRKIRHDEQVKSVVLRVNSGGGSVVSSEAILEELKTLDVPIICSMGNYAASGGYYIVSNVTQKIFALPTTITGSIGVFGVKIDATKWAKSYGIRSDYHPHGNHAAAPHPLTPLTSGTKENIERMTLAYYNYFKGIVAAGRCLGIEEVEKVAQGRVWTGEQAKEVGLVDALGGLDRAITYAKSNYTTSDRVEIEHWPTNTSFFDLSEQILKQSLSSADIIASILSSIGGNEIDQIIGVERILTNIAQMKFEDKPYFMFAMDEKTVIELIVMGE